METKIDFFILAGEDSGDFLGEKLIQDLKAKNPSLTIKAVAGPRMRKEQPELFFPMEKLQTMGFLDVLLAIPRLFFHFFKTKRWLLKHQPKTVVLIDYPGFNLRLEKALKKQGFSGKLIHYVSPTVWAHGEGRIKWMQKNLDLLLTLFPFEKRFLKNYFGNKKNGLSQKELKVQYVGHPLLEHIEKHLILSQAEGPKLQNLNSTGYKKEKDQFWIGLFPGSREKEILLNLPLQLKALKKAFVKKPFHLFVSLAHIKFEKTVKELVRKYYLRHDKNKHPVSYIFFSDHYQIMSKLDMAIAKSGTINLELAFFEIPTIVTYRIRKLELFMARKMLKIDLPFYCLVNILQNKLIFPELYGPNFTEEKLTVQLNGLLTDPIYQAKIKKACQGLKKSLKKEQTLNAAETILALNQKNSF